MTSRSARKRLIAANRNLSLKEEQIREILKLRVQPRLSLLDESSVTYVTAEGRDDLDREDQGPAGSRPD
jgi:hypothetical protein